MPSSNYTAFDVKVESPPGVVALVPNAVIEVRDVTDEVADPTDATGIVLLDDIESDVNGHVAPGTLPVAAGRKIRFTWIGPKGIPGCAEGTTF